VAGELGFFQTVTAARAETFLHNVEDDRCLGTDSIYELNHG